MLPIEKEDQKIFVAALDWGWGHVTRSAALIQNLLSANHKIVIGGSGSSGKFLKDQFPELKYYELPGYEFTFDDTKNVYWQMMKKIPEITQVMKKEQEALDVIHQKENFDLVISDHRYGLRLSDVKSILLCHQLNLQAGNYSRIVNALHHSLIQKFDQIWVPDDEDNTLSGKLSHVTMKLEEKVSFIGPLTTVKHESSRTKDIDVLVICTGPEPQRTRFEEVLSSCFSLVNKPFNGIVVQGAEKSPIVWGDRWSKILLAQREEITDMIQRAKMIVSRSGYSTIMDLYPFDIPTMLIPTPGQTEQEYLALHLQNYDNVLIAEQDELTSETILGFLEGERECAS